jgi:toxin ParE1/3/4
MRVKFEPAARDELEQIQQWIADVNPRAADALIARIEDKVMRLAMPGMAQMGRLGLIDGTRELIEFPYVIVYAVHEAQNEIVIVSVVHGARNRKQAADD